MKVGDWWVLDASSEDISSTSCSVTSGSGSLGLCVGVVSSPEISSITTPWDRVAAGEVWAWGSSGSGCWTVCRDATVGGLRDLLGGEGVGPFVHWVTLKKKWLPNIENRKLSDFQPRPHLLNPSTWRFEKKRIKLAQMKILPLPREVRSLNFEKLWKSKVVGPFLHRVTLFKRKIIK